MVVMLSVLAVDLLAVSAPAPEAGAGVCYRLEAAAPPAQLDARPSTDLFAEVSRPHELVARSATYILARADNARAPARSFGSAVGSARSRYVVASRPRPRRKTAAAAGARRNRPSAASAGERLRNGRRRSPRA